MKYCSICKNDELDDYASCEKCFVGLCETCYDKYEKAYAQIFRTKIRSCNVCKRDFNEFCDFCKNQTLSYMKHDEFIGKPNEYLKTYFNFCDCESRYHCHNISHDLARNELNIPFLLFERSTYVSLCKDCFIKDVNISPLELGVCRIV